jgi:hypothetical protein
MPSVNTAAVSQLDKASAENTPLTTSKTLYWLLKNAPLGLRANPSVSEHPRNG